MSTWVVGFFGILSSLFPGTAKAEPPQRANADLRLANGQFIGRVTFSQEGTSVKLKGKLKGLRPGLHGIHIHEVGRCDPPHFVSSGGHFNPRHQKHGRLNSQESHLGDLSNLSVDVFGNAKLEIVIEKLSILGGKDNSLLKEGGTALIIHENEDDEKTDPSGSSGGRIACGVIKT